MIRYVVNGRWIWDRDASQYYAITLSRPIRIDGHAVKVSRSTRGACLNKANRVARMATISAGADIINLDRSKIDRLSVEQEIPSPFLQVFAFGEIAGHLLQRWGILCFKEFKNSALKALI